MKDCTLVHHNCIKKQLLNVFHAAYPALGNILLSLLPDKMHKYFKPYFKGENQRCTVSCFICANASIYVQSQRRTAKIEHGWWWWDQTVWFGILFVVRWLKYSSVLSCLFSCWLFIDLTIVKDLRAEYRYCMKKQFNLHGERVKPLFKDLGCKLQLWSRKRYIDGSLNRQKAVRNTTFKILKASY